MIRRQLPQIAAATGIRDEAFYQQAISSALSRINCAPSARLSLWVAALNLAVTDEDVVTGDYEQYTGALENAMLSSYDPDDAANRMDAVLASATTLGSGDAQVLAAIASLGASSAAYWYAVEQSGGGDGGGSGAGIEPIEPMSIYRYSSCGYWCRIGWSDLVGSVSGAAQTIIGSGGAALIVTPTVIAGAAIGGLAGSAAAAI